MLKFTLFFFSISCIYSVFCHQKNDGLLDTIVDRLASQHYQRLFNSRLIEIYPILIQHASEDDLPTIYSMQSILCISRKKNEGKEEKYPRLLLLKLSKASSALAAPVISEVQLLGQEKTITSNEEIKKLTHTDFENLLSFLFLEACRETKVSNGDPAAIGGVVLPATLIDILHHPNENFQLFTCSDISTSLSRIRQKLEGLEI